MTKETAIKEAKGKRLEVELEGELCESGLIDRHGCVMGPKFFVSLRIPKYISRELAENAIDNGYKPNDKIKYKATFEIVD